MKSFFSLVGDRIRELALRVDNHDLAIRIDELGRMLITASAKITDIEFE